MRLNETEGFDPAACVMRVFLRRWKLYAAISLLFTGLFLHPLLLPFIPVVLSLYVWAAVCALNLAPRPSLLWWVERVASYWILGIATFILYLAGLVLLYALLYALGGSAARDFLRAEGLFLLAAALFSAPFVARFWPLLAAAFLVEGRRYYNSPLRHYLLWYAGPAWLGPTFFDAWRWTGKDAVARKFSARVLLAWVLCALSLVAAALLSSLFPTAQLLFVFVACNFIVAPFFIFAAICCWYALFSVGVSPLVCSSEELPPIDAEMADIQTQLLAERNFQYRFPTGEWPIWKYLLPSSQVASSRQALLKEMADASPCRAFHGGEYLEMWSDASSMRNDVTPDLILDFQGAVLMICVLEQNSKAMSRIFELLERWGARFPVIGLGL